MMALNEWLLNDQPEKAEEALLALKDIFGDDNIFVELQDHGMEEQKKCLPELVRIARKTNTPIVAKWVKQAEHSGSFHEKDNRTPEQQELLRLRKENQQLKMENDILKQAALILGRK